MSPIFELRELPAWAAAPDGVPPRPLGCTWLANVIGQPPSTWRWGLDPLEAVERAGEAFSSSGGFRVGRQRQDA